MRSGGLSYSRRIDAVEVECRSIGRPRMNRRQSRYRGSGALAPLFCCPRLRRGWRKGEPASDADGLLSFCLEGLVELVLQADTHGLERRGIFQDAARAEIFLRILRVAVFEA